MRLNLFYPEVEFNFISTLWPNLPSGLQAAYEFAERDEVRFFKGNSSRYCSVSVNPSALRLSYKRVLATFSPWPTENLTISLITPMGVHYLN